MLEISDRKAEVFKSVGQKIGMAHPRMIIRLPKLLGCSPARCSTCGGFSCDYDPPPRFAIFIWSPFQKRVADRDDLKAGRFYFLPGYARSELVALGLLIAGLPFAIVPNPFHEHENTTGLQCAANVPENCLVRRHLVVGIG